MWQHGRQWQDDTDADSKVRLFFYILLFSWWKSEFLCADSCSTTRPHDVSESLLHINTKVKLQQTSKPWLLSALCRADQSEREIGGAECWIIIFVKSPRYGRVQTLQMKCNDLQDIPVQIDSFIKPSRPQTLNGISFLHKHINSPALWSVAIPNKWWRSLSENLRSAANCGRNALKVDYLLHLWPHPRRDVTACGGTRGGEVRKRCSVDLLPRFREMLLVGN